ncbi:MAG: acyl carrier protein [Deltaproteobacteria bacterium]|nr:acyl carrier protein [Deltaproteobacteria bacterium]
MNQELKQKLKEIIAEIAEIEDIPDDKPFKDLGIDSMMAIEIITDVERIYKIKIPEEELERIVDLNSVVVLVEEKLAQA